MVDPSAENVILKYALQNAFLYGGKANAKAVQGKVMAEQPALRPHIKEIIPLIESVLARVNAMSLEEQKSLLESIDPSLTVKKEKVEKVHRLVDLPGAVNGQVVMRFAPGPSGPLHLGHTRVAILNDEYCKRYNGKFINRMEDTNPEKIDPDAYKMIPEDLEWLGVKVDETVIQSERFPFYYEIARQLIEMGKAYICTCPVEDWRNAKEASRPCPHRDLPVEEQLEKWDKMLAGHYEEEKAVLVVKTDLDHPNPAIRDFVGFRIVKSVPHPRTGDRYCVYPMMNFCVAVDDHYLGLTHVIRGKDHLNNTLRQEYIFRYFGWKMPWYHHYGLVSIPDAILKTSTVGKGIKTGEYTGWDDVRLGTVRAMEKRGIQADSIRAFWIDCGIKEVDIEFSWDTLYSYNRDRVDKAANRYFFVWDPQPLDICGVDELHAKVPKHPDHPERGYREHRLSGRPIMVFVTEEDLAQAVERGKVRLKDLGNIEIVNGKGRYIGNDLSILKEKVKIVHWVPDSSVECTVLMPDGTRKQGRAERVPDEEVGKVVQFERFGFARIGRVSPKVEAYFTHD
ncbi:MAG: glutamate--tRNA ligase [Methanomassiliicoccales archaeon]|nr:MAG: glutamate--tRNA ligase [Methanomassiliicoccales archaeon]